MPRGGLANQETRAGKSPGLRQDIVFPGGGSSPAGLGARGGMFGGERENEAEVVWGGRFFGLADIVGAGGGFFGRRTQGGFGKGGGEFAGSVADTASSFEIWGGDGEDGGGDIAGGGTDSLPDISPQ